MCYMCDLLIYKTTTAECSTDRIHSKLCCNNNDRKKTATKLWTGIKVCASKVFDNQFYQIY